MAYQNYVYFPGRVCLCTFYVYSTVSKSSLILDYERWARSWSRFLGSQPTGDFVINPVVSWRYFPPGPQLLFQPKWSAPWPVPNYTAWCQRHTGVSSLPKATTQWCPAGTRNRDPFANPLSCCTSATVAIEIMKDDASVLTLYNCYSCHSVNSMYHFRTVSGCLQSCWFYCDLLVKQVTWLASPRSEAQAHVCLPVLAPPGECYYTTVLCCDIVECGITHFLCAMCVFEVGHHPHSLGYLCAKFHFFCGLHCWASPWRKIAYTVTHPAFWCPGNRSACTSEPSVFVYCAIYLIYLVKPAIGLFNGTVPFGTVCVFVPSWIKPVLLCHCCLRSV